jgi:hypothetical protein
MEKISIPKSVNNGAWSGRLLIIIAGSFLWYGNLQAEDQQQSIQYEITPYLWAASINGTTAIGGGETPLPDPDYSFFSLDNLSGVASATFTAHGEQWGFLFDFLYVEFEDTVLLANFLPATPKLNGRILEFAGTYRPVSINDFQIIAGLRRQDIDVELAILDQTPQASVDWTDPFVGVIYTPALTNKLSLGLRGDIGGFGIESDLAVNAEAMLRYQFGDTFSFKFGYRYLKVDFEDSSLVYDISLDGLLLGLGIAF